MAKTSKEFDNPALFICDIQERFRSAIYGFDHVISTSQKVLKTSKILNIPIYATTQLSAKLGPTCKELNLDNAADPESYITAGHGDKSSFSMCSDASIAAATAGPRKMQVAIVGIETHICVSQTARALKRAGHEVYVLADGVSSCNREEGAVALARLRAEGVVVTTSEAWMYEVVGDAKAGQFKEIVGVVKEWKEKTTEALKTLCG